MDCRELERKFFAQGSKMVYILVHHNVVLKLSDFGLYHLRGKCDDSKDLWSV